MLKSAEINADWSTLPATNLTDLTQDGLPPGIVESDIALAGKSTVAYRIAAGINVLSGKWKDDGAAHQFMSYHFDQGSSGAGWSTIELALVRLNETYAPRGQFHVYDGATNGTRIGYDGAICVQEIRPYMLDSYNNVSLVASGTSRSRIPDIIRRPQVCQLHLLSCIMDQTLIQLVKRWKEVVLKIFNAESTLLGSGRPFQTLTRMLEMS